MTDKISIAKKYFELSNEHKLNDIFELFDENATYETQYLNKTEFNGLNEIKQMMKTFFNETVPDVQWFVESDFKIDTINFNSNLIKNYHLGDAVVADFKRLSKQNEEFNDKHGRQWVCVNDLGKIYHMKVITNQ